MRPRGQPGDLFYMWRNRGNVEEGEGQEDGKGETKGLVGHLPLIEEDGVGLGLHHRHL